ncbi:hypothetical protein FRACA_1770009 [Frankia canadensis]|uniref:Uncharacterized protein n=1 Tax=Frankia canadensis TaxID=1836972 RepID=A0A2I2KNF6_9ACTN|nr:hypothetical protein [Frankia canadensis]SNQ47207.1 hypothetical protein FRACA_1770009 [Frankia canadensis]SOU54497.1 hypothetical protein FRACA_1770009 [Frankia canadensis]
MPPYYEVAPHRGGLFDPTPRCTAPEDLLGQLLDNADEVDLSDRQIRQLLAVQARYRRVQHGLAVKLMVSAEQVRLTPESLTPTAMEHRRQVHEARGALFAQHGINGDVALAAVFRILTAEQIDTLMTVVTADVKAMLRQVAPVLVTAVAPLYTLVATTRAGLREVDPGDPREMRVEDDDRLELWLVNEAASDGEPSPTRSVPVLQGQP